jgi:heat shock protein HslJ
MKTVLLSLALLATILLVGCSDSDLIREAHPTTLAGTAWRVVAINGRPPVVGSEPTAVFGPAAVKGSAGCNSYGGSYTYDPASGRIAFQDLSMTAMGCIEPGRGEVEAMFTTAINTAASASIDPQGRLVLSGPGGEIAFTVDAFPGH